MQILVVGAGAMGSLIGGRLAGAGNTVTLFDIDQAHMTAVADRGLTISHEGGGVELHRLAATSDPAAVTAADLVLVMTKSWATTEAVASIAHAIGPDTWVVSAQNGLGADERIGAVVDPARVMPGTTTIGSTLVRPGEVAASGTVSSGTSLTQLGAPRGLDAIPPGANAVAAAFDAAGLRTEVLLDVDGVLWTKLCMAGTAGCLTALAQISIGDMIASHAAMQTWQAMLDEILAVAEADGVRLEREHVTEHAMTTYRAVGSHWASMAIDVRDRRPTEIDAMCGEVSRRGRRHGVATPVNDTVGSLILAMEDSWSDDDPG